MADTILTPIYQDYTIDLSANNNFIKVPSVQGDGNYVRYIRVLLISNNVQYRVPENAIVCIAGVKPDNKNIFNECEVQQDGRILVEITAQMTAAVGRGDYQIMLIDKTTNSNIKSFPFYLITTKSFNADEIISSNEYQILTEALTKMLADYTYIMTTCEGYKDEAETAATNAQNSEDAAKTSEDNAKDSEDAAKASELVAKASEDAALVSEQNAKTSEDNAKASEVASKASELASKASEEASEASATAASASEIAAKASEDAAKISEDNAKTSEDNAKTSEDNAKTSEDNAKTSEDNAKASELAAAASAEAVADAEETCAQSAEDAEEYADLARKWAVWEDGVQEPSSNNNARFWANKAKEWSGFDDIDASSVTYTKDDGTKVWLSDYLHFLEELDGQTILVL